MVTAEQVWEALGTVNDPEYPLSIVDLGMVYDVRVTGADVTIDMTFTSIGCPAIDMILDDLRAAAATVPDVGTIDINVVWSPPWTKDRISTRGQRLLQLHGVVN
jgi:metal-sulfur cluster biosynthetic enzyme